MCPMPAGVTAEEVRAIEDVEPPELLKPDPRMLDIAIGSRSILMC
jgi:hypothetical protein